MGNKPPKYRDEFLFIVVVDVDVISDCAIEAGEEPNAGYLRHVVLRVVNNDTVASAARAATATTISIATIVMGVEFRRAEQ